MKQLICFSLSVLFSVVLPAKTVRWSEAEANQWSNRQGWILGANFIPRDAINSIEMWDRTTFDAPEIDRELGQAEQIGFKTVRVFLNDLVYQDDPKGFFDRVDTFLALAQKHHIRPLLVLFDSCWNAHPHLGPQPAPVAGVHNSGWVQSPGVDGLNDAARLEGYVKGVIGHFANDSRILAWDLWNEPDNLNTGSTNDPAPKVALVVKLLPQVFAWARASDPSQPLTSGVWNGDWSTDQALRPIEHEQLELSDVITFHNYEPAAQFETKVKQLQRLNRPVICTEYMARPLGSTFQTILPIAKANHVDAFNWGFVAGKTQTYLPWDSWQHPYPVEPKIWFHDLLRADGAPFDASEIKFLQTMTGHP